MKYTKHLALICCSIASCSVMHNAEAASGSFGDHAAAIAAGNNTALASGTVDNPWIVEDCIDLQAIGSGAVSTVVNDMVDDYYLLNNHIDCSATAEGDQGVGDIWTNNGFEPLGGINAAAFTANFDSNNFEIRNLYINRPTEDNVGLFRELNSAANGIHISGGDITGEDNVGGIAGELGGVAISDLIFTGSIQGFGGVGAMFGRAIDGSPSITNAGAKANIIADDAVGGNNRGNIWRH